MKLLIALSIVASTSASVVNLTPSNFAELTAGKTVFIKYFAPWCGHCQAMASDWESLASEWVDHKDGLIGEVDCDNDANEPLCSAAGVQGFPTLKWGDPDGLQDYNGGRDLASLSTFAQENLKPMCSVKNIELCSDEKKAAIEKYQKMSDDELSEIVTKVKTFESESDDTMNEEIEKLQEKYESLMAEHDARVKKAKDENDFSLVSSILASRGVEIEDEAPDMDDDDDDDDEDDDDDDDDDEDEGHDEF